MMAENVYGTPLVENTSKQKWSRRISDMAVGFTTDLIPFAKSYKCAKQGKPAEAVIWGAFDLASFICWAVPPAGAAAQIMATGAKTASTYKLIPPLLMRTAKVAEKAKAAKVLAKAALAERVAPVIAKTKSLAKTYIADEIVAAAKEITKVRKVYEFASDVKTTFDHLLGRKSDQTDDVSEPNGTDARYRLTNKAGTYSIPSAS